MNILITGIDGFTGKNLETFLSAKGYSIFGTVLEESEKENYIKCDIRNKGEVNTVIGKVKPDYIFHLAAISFVGEANKSMIYDVNVLGTQNILDSLLFFNLEPKKIIIASSAVIYGNPDQNVLNETMCPEPVNHYGYSKLAMEHLVATYFDKLNILITRPFNYTGVGHSENFIIPKIVSHFVAKKSTIELGNLDVAREFNDIRTVVDMYYKLMISNAKSDTVNLCTGNVIKLKEVLSYMEQIAGYKIDVQVNTAFIRKNEIPVLKGSVEKLFTLINFTNAFKIKDTLETMYKGTKYD